MPVAACLGNAQDGTNREPSGGWDTDRPRSRFQVVMRMRIGQGRARSTFDKDGAPGHLHLIRSRR